MNKNKSIVDRIEAFTVKRDFKVGKVLFKTNEVYNRVDIFNEGEFFINFKYNDEEVNSQFLVKFPKSKKTDEDEEASEDDDEQDDSHNKKRGKSKKAIVPEDEELKVDFDIEIG